MGTCIVQYRAAIGLFNACTMSNSTILSSSNLVFVLLALISNLILYVVNMTKNFYLFKNGSYAKTA